MGSGGKRKTTMAKLAREHRLRERRLDKQARKEARKNAPPEEAATADSPGVAAPLSTSTDDDPLAAAPPASVTAEPSDPRVKEAALLRLRDASDEQLAVFEGHLRDSALRAGATESEMRAAERDHPGHVPDAPAPRDAEQR
jgi:hypothetical protein